MVLKLRRYKNQPPIEVIIDESDYDRVSQHKWWIMPLGYINTRIAGKYVYLHRFIAQTPKGMVTDHINGDKLDNRKSNLRICSTRENVINSKLSKNNRTGFRGTSFRKDRNKYSAYIMVNRKKISLGTYEYLEDAVNARVAGERKYFGIFAPKS